MESLVFISVAIVSCSISVPMCRSIHSINLNWFVCYKFSSCHFMCGHKIKITHSSYFEKEKLDKRKWMLLMIVSLYCPQRNKREREKRNDTIDIHPFLLIDILWHAKANQFDWNIIKNSTHEPWPIDHFECWTWYFVLWTQQWTTRIDTE